MNLCEARQPGQFSYTSASSQRPESTFLPCNIELNNFLLFILSELELWINNITVNYMVQNISKKYLKFNYISGIHSGSVDMPL